jgi:hypothetical protein
LIREELVKSNVIEILVDFLPDAAKRLFFERKVRVRVTEFGESFCPFFSVLWCAGFCRLEDFADLVDFLGDFVARRIALGVRMRHFLAHLAGSLDGTGMSPEKKNYRRSFISSD